MLTIGTKIFVVDSKSSYYGNSGVIVQNDKYPTYLIQITGKKMTQLNENQIRVAGRSFSGKRFDASKGEVIKECPAGWTLVKAIVTIKGVDKTIFKLVKGKDTPSNREQWDEIRGAMLTYGFKWNRFNQTFDKFNTVDDVNLDELCNTLARYYGGEQTTAPTTTQNAPEPPSTSDDNINDERYEVVRYELEENAPWFVYRRRRDEITKTIDYFLWNDDTKEFDIFWRALSQEEANREYIALSNGKYEGHFISKEQAEKLATLGTSGRLEILKGITNTPLDKYGVFVSIKPFDIKKKDNIRLKYCRIMWAEGFAEYADEFPKTFSSFTALTKYIRENIGEIPTQGYDKHGVEWIWDNGDWGENRWDVSENEANPNKFSNLWAYESFRGRFYDCIINKAILSEWDDFYVARGLDGLELTKQLFDSIVDNWTSSDYWKKQSKMTQAQMKAKIEECLPKLYALFTPSNNKADIEKKIRGLELILGNDDVQGAFAEELKKKIRGLKLLLQ